MAESNVRKGHRRRILPWLIATIVLGFVFLAGQSMEYYKLIQLNITVHKNVFGSAFFTLTGFHGLHVMLGLIVLMIVAGLIVSGKFRSIEKSAFESVSIYWHFVDIVWIAVFSVVYIGAII
jgi:heme/copper-type cytochrome/quinol oxidase subunit 3